MRGKEGRSILRLPRGTRYVRSRQLKCIPYLILYQKLFRKFRNLFVRHSLLSVLFKKKIDKSHVQLFVLSVLRFFIKKRLRIDWKISAAHREDGINFYSWFCCISYLPSILKWLHSSPILKLDIAGSTNALNVIPKKMSSLQYLPDPFKLSAYFF